MLHHSLISSFFSSLSILLLLTLVFFSLHPSLDQSIHLPLILSEFTLPDEADLFHATRDGEKNVFDEMIGLYPTEDVDLHASSRKEGEKPVFEESKKKPQVSYRGDGRKQIDGILQEAQGANALWTTTISRGVAHQWKDKSEGRIARAQRYISETTYEVLKYNRYISIVALVTLNLFLIYILYRLL